MPYRGDRIIKLPSTSEASPRPEHPSSSLSPRVVTSHDEALEPSSPAAVARLNSSHGRGLHIVYDSENKDVVPYPEGEFIRTPSPEHSGIPARPVKVPLRVKEEEYTSDDSIGDQGRKKAPPPCARRKAKIGIK